MTECIYFPLHKLSSYSIFKEEKYLLLVLGNGNYHGNGNPSLQWPQTCLFCNPSFIKKASLRSFTSQQRSMAVIVPPLTQWEERKPGFSAHIQWGLNHLIYGRRIVTVCTTLLPFSSILFPNRFLREDTYFLIFITCE